MHTRSRPGAMLLLAVLIVGAAALSVSLMVALRAIGELDSSTVHTASAQAKYVADACAEEALLRIGRNPSYNSGSLTLGKGTCTIAAAQSGSNIAIDVRAVVDSAHFNVDILFNPSGPTIERWEHVR